MMTFIISLLLLALAIAGVVIRKTYDSVPLKELKRQAQQGDQLATELYRAVAYGPSLGVLLWIFITLCSAGGFVLLSSTVPTSLSFVAVVVLLWVAFTWLPTSKVSSLGRRLTVSVTPSIVWLLNYLYPILSRAIHRVQSRRSAPHHTGVYERSDLLDLITRQQKQHDNRLSQEELEIVRRALTFDQFTVADILTPRKQVPIVKADDTAGPITIDELHKSGQPYALVRDTPKGPFIGFVDIAHLGLGAQGTIADVMNQTIYYLHENDSLSEALHVFFVTNNSLFVVVNSFEEFVGILTLEHVVKQLIGHIPGDDFDQYTNISAVAARHTDPETEVVTDSE